jgi:hypothetical protein
MAPSGGRVRSPGGDRGRVVAVLGRIAVVVAMVSVTALVVANPWQAPGGDRPEASRPTAVAASPTLSLPDLEGRQFTGPSFELSLVRSPTAEKAQSKAWYAEETWWLIAVVGDRATHRILRLDVASRTWLDTGVLVDERPDANVDTLIDGDMLYVASAAVRADPTSAGLLTRFHYVPAEGRYVRDPDFPVALTEAGVESIVLARDGRDRLWATWMVEGRLMVSHSLDDDRRWIEPFTPPVEGVQADPDDVSAIVSVDDRVGVMWSNQRDGAFYYVEHREVQGDTGWSPTETVVRGSNMADDHVNLKSAPRGRVVAALKTSRDRDAGSSLASQILLAVRDPDGTWRQAVAGRVKDRHTRPVVLVDGEREVAYILAASPFRGGVVYLKQTPLDRLVLESGLGTPLIASADDPRLANVTSTKQQLTVGSGLVAVASDNTTGRYVTTILPITPGGGPRAVELPPLTDTSLDLVDEAFEVASIDGGLPYGWSLRAPTADAAAVTRTGELGVLRLATPAGGENIRACRAIPALTGRLSATLRLRVSSAERSDAIAALARGPGGDVAEFRLTRDGRIGYVKDGVRVLLKTGWTPGRWYDVRLDLSASERLARLEIRAVGGAASTAVELPWSAGALGVDEICVGLGPGVPGRTLDVDSLSVVGRE